ncbi:hypothetical protein GGTG_12582 [Gaeumannomyces tritici R3-111a-1]|uniref:Zn(2)-C6 fungal-type domain-containing protein n=1 Tax=Gaeumannomyces tritici (strain R3-111a-1) TaxID=644352 RepID=J3PGF7_GAET3|nr:hypothetical protein GGTG_12582 [Gaeumannomyces tritici R3-111a-1]EJT69699.1 hypothetical protein GGTG_12582 [Gaeumannomyces tritici R3-111a-1]
MDILHAVQASQPSPSIVQQYLAQLCHGDVVDHRSGLVGRLCAECIAVFRETLRAISKEREALNGGEAYTSLERSYGRLRLWSDGHGIAAGKFDEVFDRSKGLRYTILKLLTRLIPLALTGHGTSAPALSKGIHLLRELQDVVQSVQSDDFSDSSSADLSSDTIGDVIEDLKIDTTCLADLDHLLKDPILEIDIEQAAPADRLLDWHPDSVYSHKIGARFPQADVSLVEWLGKANYLRYLRCQHARETCESAATYVAAPAQSETASSKFNDSGLGSSLPSTTSYAETVMSYGGRGSQSVKIPPLTAEAKAGVPFSCTACGKVVSITSNSMWKKHLFEDLRPWLCLDMACPSSQSPFETRQDWASHLALDHKLDPEWASFSCQLCLEPTGSGRLAITKHLGAHLEEVSLAAIPSQLDFDDNSDQSRPSSSADGEDLEDEAVESAAKLKHAESSAPSSARPQTAGEWLRDFEKRAELNEEEDGESSSVRMRRLALLSIATKEAGIAAGLRDAKDFKNAQKAYLSAMDILGQTLAITKGARQKENLQSLGQAYATQCMTLEEDIRIASQAHGEGGNLQSTFRESPKPDQELSKQQQLLKPARKHSGEEDTTSETLQGGGGSTVIATTTASSVNSRTTVTNTTKISATASTSGTSGTSGGIYGYAAHSPSSTKKNGGGTGASNSRATTTPVDTSTASGTLQQPMILWQETRKPRFLRRIREFEDFTQILDDESEDEDDNGDLAADLKAKLKKGAAEDTESVVSENSNLHADGSDANQNRYTVKPVDASPQPPPSMGAISFAYDYASPLRPPSMAAINPAYVIDGPQYRGRQKSPSGPNQEVASDLDLSPRGQGLPIPSPPVGSATDASSELFEGREHARTRAKSPAEAASKREAEVSTFADPEREDQTEAGATEAPQTPVKRMRTTKPKTKTGCRNCRQRKIKCDEQRPACTQCVRSRKECTGYMPQANVEEKAIEKASEAAPAAEPRARPGANISANHPGLTFGVSNLRRGGYPPTQYHTTSKPSPSVSRQHASPYHTRAYARQAQQSGYPHHIFSTSASPIPTVQNAAQQQATEKAFKAAPVAEPKAGTSASDRTAKEAGAWKEA